MARTRKSIQPLNLYKYDVLIEDKGVRSDYFKISQFDGYFYGGRNSFLVAGAGNLRPNSNILVEILNKDGNTVYSAPITSFVEGNSRLIQVEVYSDTPIGPGKIVILGCATTYAAGDPIPLNWRDRYNVRWITDVIISPRIQNKTPIRFLEEPTIVVDEKFYKAPSSSLFTRQVAVPVDIEIVPKYYNVFPNGYQLKIVGPGNTKYNSDYYNGLITGSIRIFNGNESDTASIRLPITKIYNKELAETEGSLIYTNNNKLILDGFISSSGSYLSSITPFGNTQVTGSINLEYNVLETFNTGSDVSYARLRVVGAKTLSGEVNKLRVSYKTTTEPGEFVVLSDVDVGVQELLAIDSGSKIVPTGKFKNAIINDYWYSATMSLQKNESSPVLPNYYNSSSLISTPFDVSQCCTDLLDSINVTPPISNSKFVNDVSYFVGTRKENFIRLFPKTEYTLAFDAFVSKASSSLILNQKDYSLEVYLVEHENTKNKILDTNRLGQLVGVLTPQSNFLRQNFERVEFNFTPKIISDGNFGLRFVIYGGNWSLANVSVKPAQEPFFSPDEIDILVPNVNYANKILTFKVQYLDINNNSAEIASFSIPTYFTGSALPSNYVILSGSSGAGFPFVGDAQITGSLSVLGSISGSIASSSYSISSSHAATASYVSGAIVDWNTLSNKPNNLISSSLQFTSLTDPFTGSFTGSFVGDGSGLTNLPYTSNVQIDNYTFVGDGLTTAYVLSKAYHDSSLFISVDGLVQTNTVDYIIFTNTINFISTPPSESNIFIRGIVNTTTSSIGTFSGSFIGNIENAVFAITATTASYIIPSGLPNGTVSSSSQINTGSFSGSITTASFAITSSYIIPSGLPNGTVSSSLQVDYTQIQNKPTTINTASYVEFINIGNKPTLVSSSLQINTGSFSGSITSASYAITASYAQKAASVNYTDITNKPELISASSQVDVRNTIGISTIATTGSNTFTGVQTISNTTNSTTFSNGALIVQGGIGVAKDVNISGSLTISGLLTATSTSIQYITSSQLNVADNRIIVNTNDLLRFGGLSVIDSGSSSPTTASIFWDSLEHRFIYENLSGSAYNSSIFIAGPKHTGTLGGEAGIVDNRVPVGFAGDHIDNRPASSSIRVDFPSRLTHIEAGLYVTGAITSSVGFSGNGTGISGIISSSYSITSSLTSLAATASYISGGTVIIGLPTDGTYGGSSGNVSGIGSGDKAEDAFDKIETILGRLAPAKPANLSTRTLTTNATTYTAFTASGPTPSSFSNITATARPTASWTFAAATSGSGTTLSFDADSGTLQAEVDGAVAPLSQDIFTTASDVGTFGDLIVTADLDPYNGTFGQQGFWKGFLASVAATRSLALGPHTYRLLHSTTGNTPTFTWYLDNPSTPSVTSVTGSSSGGSTRYVSGVPTLAAGETVTIVTTASNAISQFYNPTRIFSAVGNNSVASSVNATLPSVPPASSSVVSASITLTVASNAYAISSSYTVTAFNAAGTTGTSTWTPTVPIRVDTLSNESPRCRSGIGWYPLIDTTVSGAGAIWTASANLTGSRELQMTANLYHYPSASNYSINYPTSGPNYIGLVADTITSFSGEALRWVTFSSSIAAASNISVVFNNATNFTGIATTGSMRLYVLVSGSNSTNGWIDGAASYPGTGNPTNNGDPALVFASSTTTTKVITFGSIVKTGIVFVRVGIPSSSLPGSNRTFSGVTITQV